MALPDGVTGRLAEQLSLLALDPGRDGPALLDGLGELVTTLHDAVSGYAGLRLTLVHTGHPVHLTVLSEPHPGPRVVTSLGVLLAPVSRVFEEGGRLVLWSTVTGSLVDLAADLDHVLRPRATGVAVDGGGLVVAPRATALDADLPLGTEVVTGVDGLDELATVHRALGLLLGQGLDPQTAYETLVGGAASEGLTTHAWAHRLLRRR